ncbi:MULTISPECIES: hypothetical protein [unclassified Bradyrhizobium]|uniref:hypothetical protein n=1 Tax=unclassified Bradyrhizobium TaxID=2631580 RepID=UPI001FF798A6|nr:MULTISPECIES: hypothetical protein [unclassified Bradyrhizobium]MCK1612482.1 hypothetical protein [Bradyrhizobium sp. 163]MCK1762598.1 hypothetical protein [Bradyrhizobium sp. 136]
MNTGWLSSVQMEDVAQLRAHRAPESAARLLIEGSPDVLEHGTSSGCSRKQGWHFGDANWSDSMAAKPILSMRAHKLLVRAAKQGARRARRDRSSIDDAIA